jgi:hypothetical protein
MEYNLKVRLNLNIECLYSELSIIGSNGERNNMDN